MSNPYLCGVCGGELSHDLDCPARPAALAQQEPCQPFTLVGP